MVNQQLLDYIKQQSQQNTSKEQIKSALLANGWQIQDIDEAFSLLASPSQPLTPTDTLSQSQPFSEQPSKRVNKILLVVVLIIAGILIISSGVFAYFNYFQSSKKIVQKMITKLTEIKSLEYSGEIKVEANVGDLLDYESLLQPTQPEQNKKTSNFLINFTGKTDIQKLDDLKGLFSFNIKTDSLSQGESDFGLETRNIGKVIYVKFGDIPNLGSFDLSAVKNQWIRIDIEALKKQFGLEKIEEQLKEAQNKKELTPEQIEKIRTAVQQSKIFKVIEKLASEKIEGVTTYHYKFTIDKTEIKKLFIDIGRIVQEKTLTENELADFDKDFEVFELPEGEVWIGKKDLFPYKITLSSVIKETEKSKTSGKINITFLFKNFNKPVQIDIPQQVKSLEEFLGELFGGLQGLAPGGTFPSADQQDFNKYMDKDGLPNQLETNYSTY